MTIGRFGPEFLVNTTTASSQFESSIAVLADGRFVVSWTDEGATGGDFGERSRGRPSLNRIDEAQLRIVLAGRVIADDVCDLARPKYLPSISPLLPYLAASSI